ncbi:MAG: Arginine repressor [Mycoplasmataceae bacterium]|nr:MAG: Arginine repressor [Mycoplasmataceae bacterium]
MVTKIKLSIRQIIELKKKGITQKEIAKIFRVTQQTIIRWKRPQFISQKRGCKPKISENVFEFLNSYITKNNVSTQQEMVSHIYQEIGLKISQQTISRILKKNNYTYKKLTYHYAEQNEEKVKKFIKNVKPLLSKYSFLAMDECGFHLNEDPRRGYSLKGIRAVSKRPSSKGEHYTLLLCIKNVKRGGVVHYQLVKGGANWRVFYDFLEDIKLTSNKKHYLLMDNARIHFAHKKREEKKLPNVKEQMANKNTEVINIVSYSPQLNPTELCFNFLRQNIEKNRPRNLEELKNYIDKALRDLNKQDLTKYFRHCFNYLKIINNGKGKQNYLLSEKRRIIKQNINPRYFNY